MPRIMKKTVLVLSAVFVIALQNGIGLAADPPVLEASSGTPLAEKKADAPSVDELLARVNGSAIHRSEVDRVIRIFIAESRVSHDISSEARQQAEAAALEQLIATRLLYQVGLKREIKDLDRQIADRIAREKAKFPSPAGYDAALKSNNFTEQDAQQVVRNDIVVSSLVNNEIIAKIVVTDAEARSYYDQNLDKFTKQENIRLCHILVGVDPQSTGAEKQQARTKAESIRNRILAGADFAAVARAESSCPSQEEGGDLGYFEKNDLIREFEEGTELLKLGDISQVVETKDGYHVLKLVERNPRIVQPFEATKEKIASFLTQIQTQQAIREYVTELRKKAIIERVAHK